MVMVSAIIIGSYLLGSIPAAYFAGRIARTDIRDVGSGNIGATNVVRTLGKRYGYPVFAFDFLKGWGAVRLSMFLVGRFQPAPISPEVAGIIAAVSCIFGHSFPIWLGFKGGKGVAPSAGSLFGLMPVGLLIGAVIWLLTFRLTRYVSVASMIAALVLPIVIAILSSLGLNGDRGLVYFSICMAAFIILRHRSNLSRLIRGTEPRFTRK